MPETRSAETAMLLSVKGVQGLTGIHWRTFLRYADAGLAPWGVKIGVLRRWQRDEIVGWIRAGCPKVRPAGKAVRRCIRLWSLASFIPAASAPACWTY